MRAAASRHGLGARPGNEWHPVARTCTEITLQNSPQAATIDHRPLAAFRPVPAYVLLGDPGSGKTTEFRSERADLGGGATYVTARDFVTLDLDSHPEWRGTTLFIDGLDEMRAGATDARSPLDAIRNRLERLGRPRFRLSCREADWLGPNDRRSLETVSPDSRITVLLLDPLDDQAVRDLITRQVVEDRAEAFEDEARHRGLGAMLANPQALELLVDATEHGGAWPQSRLATFDLACRKMAVEHNDEHQAVEPTHSPENILDAAGHLCTLLLLCGLDGFTLAPRDTKPGGRADGFVFLNDLGVTASSQSRGLLRAALSTKLFKPGGEAELVPRHRQIAEFLAGRRLARLIEQGLPASRVLALMTSSVDGRVVSALRGLSAWLAAHASAARRLLVEADPVGVGLYGDIANFSTEDRQRLLTSLVSFAAEGPLFGHARQDGRAHRYRDDTAWAFRRLASADMVEPLRNALENPPHGTDHDRTCEFVTAVLSEVEASETESLIALEPALIAILRDADRPPWVTARALDAYIHIAPRGEHSTRVLVELLEAIRVGVMPDPGEGLRVTLLEDLYPRVIGAAEVWRCGLPRPGHNAIGSLSSFWHLRVLREYSEECIAELLDALCEDTQHLVRAIAHSYLNDLPLQLLARGLRAFGDTLDMDRLFGWLDVAGNTHRACRGRDEDALFVKQWLDDRPEVWKGLFLAWLRERVASEPEGLHRYLSCRPLLYVRPPADFGLWCLDQATALQDSEPTLARELLGQAYWALPDPAIRHGLTLAAMRDRAGTGVLAHRLAELEHQRSAAATEAAEAGEWRREVDERGEQRAEEERRRQEEWRQGLSSHLDDLRHNRFSAPDLHALAKVYLGMLLDADEEAPPRQRIRDFIGGDDVLVDAVMAAIREAVFRDYVLSVNETVSLHSESQHSWLAYPVLASLHLLEKEDSVRLDGISDDRKREALAILYCVSSDRGDAPWHDRWFRQDPELVLDVLYRCAAPALRAGAEFVPCLNTLDRLGGPDDSVPVAVFDHSSGLLETRPPKPRFDGHDDTVHATRLRLLDALPTPAPSKQLRLFDDLLARAVQHPDRAFLHQLARRKLSLKSLGIGQRTRWLAVDALLSGGTDLGCLKEYVSESEVRIRHFAEFLCRTARNDDMRRSVLADARDTDVLRDAVEILGPSFGPVEWGGWITLGMEMSELIDGLIEQLGGLAGEDANEALMTLVDDPLLERWRDRLNESYERQRVVHRDASYHHPSIKEAQRTLTSGAPANAADLAALLVDRLEEISGDVRGSSGNLWRQFWNEDSHGRPTDSKPENSCRDALLATLRERLPSEVDATPEASYVSDTRADIRFGSAGFNIPLEIKKNSHPGLWSAIRRQLIDKYTTDPATSDYGIYLVLWFGTGETKTPPDGNRPDTPEALRQRLEQELTPDEARKISVIVMDVTKPCAEPAGAAFKRTTDSASGRSR